MKIKGPFTFSSGLLCKAEVLGKHYPAQIGGINVEIVFPCLPTKEHKELMNYVGMSNQLTPPDNVKIILWGEEVIWGYPIQYPRYDSYVETVLLATECNDTDIDAVAHKIYTAVQKWQISFVSFCQLLTKQNLYRSTQAKDNHNCLTLLLSEGYIQNTQRQTICGHIHGDDTFLSESQIRLAIDFASSGKEMLFEYQMLLSAYKARHNGQNRQAIVDACMAAEICIVNKIREYCMMQNIKVKPFLKKNRSLGERFRCIARFDPTFPIKDYDNVIVNPRNKVVHYSNGSPPNDHVTDRLMEAVEQCLRHYHTRYF